MSGITESKEQVKTLNDRLRRQAPFLPLPHIFVLSENVQSMAQYQEDRFRELLSRLKSFEDFNEDNDPYGEHDFGRLKLDGIDYFFKFDYFDESLQFYQDNGVRVLTLMESSEY